MWINLELLDMLLKMETLKLYQSDFPKLNESTIRPWVKKYKSELSSKKPQTSFTIGTKSGRLTILSEDQKLKAMIGNLRIAGAVINIHTVRVFWLG